MLRFDLKALPVDFVECLMRFLPTETEVKVLRQYERERRPLDQLAEEDRFMMLFSKIERLTQRMNIITFVGNFADNVSMLTPQLNAVIASSGSVKSSPKLKRVLEVRGVDFVWCFCISRLCVSYLLIPLVYLKIILALGNYMNSSKRGCVYGFKLQSLDLVSRVWRPCLTTRFIYPTSCIVAVLLLMMLVMLICFCSTAAGH